MILKYSHKLIYDLFEINAMSMINASKTYKMKIINRLRTILLLIKYEQKCSLVSEK